MHECFCDYMCAHTCVNRQICLCDWPMDGVGEGPCTCAWMNMCLSRHMRGCVCMCVPMCVGSRTSHLPALWSPAGSSPAAAQAVPSTWTMTAAALTPSSAVLPHPNRCLGSGALPGRGEQGSLFCRAQRESSERLGLGWGEHSGLAAQQDHLPSVGCLPLPAPSSFRLRVHHSGDPWELEANFPRSLAMERPQVLPLIKVRREVEETRCTQASSSHL